MARWSRRWAAGEVVKDQLNGILDQVVGPHDWPKGSVEQLIGDHYAACMDEAQVEALGRRRRSSRSSPRSTALTDIAGVQKMIGRLHELGDPRALRPRRARRTATSRRR